MSRLRSSARMDRSASLRRTGAACHGANSSAGSFTKSTSCAKRTKFTGPWTRYKAPSGKSNWPNKKSDKNREQPADTSSRTAWP